MMKTMTSSLNGRLHHLCANVRKQFKIKIILRYKLKFFMAYVSMVKPLLLQ